MAIDRSRQRRGPRLRGGARLPRLIPLFAVAGLIAASLPVGLPGAARPAQGGTVVPVPSELRFVGKGWGQGVGLSQHGDRGRALDGQVDEQII